MMRARERGPIRRSLGGGVGGGGEGGGDQGRFLILSKTSLTKVLLGIWVKTGWRQGPRLEGTRVSGAWARL